jgi:hypothetical protein
MLLLVTGCKREDVPVVNTTDVSSITRTTATCGGEIISQGDSEITERGICWSTSDKPTILDNIKIDDSDNNFYTIELTGLDPDTEYFIRAYATNNFGTGYGEIKSFITEPAIPPVINTSGITNITCTTATSGGKIISDGAAQIIDRGLCWGPSENPTIEDNFISLENEYKLNPFSYTIKDLETNSTYYVRAYATNIVGISYGEYRQFTTNNPDPQFEPDSIIGTWEIDYSCGGVAGCDDAILGLTHITEFTEDSLVIYRYMGEIFLECNFTVSGDTIRYLIGIADPAIYKLNPTFDTLSFYYPSSGFRTYYARLY